MSAPAVTVKGLTWPFIDGCRSTGASWTFSNGIAHSQMRVVNSLKVARENDCSITIETKSIEQALDNPNDKGSS